MCVNVISHFDSQKEHAVCCRAADVIAKGKVSMYVLTRKAFEGLLGPYEEMWKFEVLRKVPILFALSEAQLFELARCMTSHRLKAGQTVFRQGDPGESALSSASIVYRQAASG